MEIIIGRKAGFCYGKTIKEAEQELISGILSKFAMKTKKVWKNILTKTILKNYTLINIYKYNYNQGGNIKHNNL